MPQKKMMAKGKHAKPVCIGEALVGFVLAVKIFRVKVLHPAQPNTFRTIFHPPGLLNMLLVI